MSDVLDRAKTFQRYVAGQTCVTLKMDFLQDMIAEIERLQALVNEKTPTVKDITRRLEGQK